MEILQFDRLLIFGAVTVFAAWVVFFGGAERLEGTVKSAILVQANAPFWHAAGIKAYVGISWLGTLFWFLVL
jgi:hypothetical protein